MSTENGNSFIDQLGRGLGGLFKFIVRLLFVLVLAVAVGAGLYYGIAVGLPTLDRAYVQPVRDNTAAIAILEARATQSASAGATQVAGLQERITALEVANDNSLAALDEIQTQLETLIPLVDNQAEIADQVTALEASLQALEDALAESDIANTEALSGLETTVGENQAALAGLAAEMAGSDLPIAQAYADLQLVKAMALLTRAQVFLFQNNFGLAEQDIRTARDLLAVAASDPALAGLDLTPVLTRLSLAIGSLQVNPDLAAADLEAAWDILVSGVQVEEASPTEVP